MINEIMQRVKSLDSAGIASRTPEAIADLREVYLMAYGQSVTEGCGDCIKKAYGRLQLLTVDKLKTMKDSQDSNFKLKEGVVLPVGAFGSGEFLTAENMNDETAHKVLSKNPAFADFFEVYPKDADGKYKPDAKKEKAPAKDAKKIDGSDETVDSTPAPAVTDTPATPLNGSNEPVDQVPAAAPVTDPAKKIDGSDEVVDELPAPKKTEAEIKSYLSNITRAALVEEYVSIFGKEPDAEKNKTDIYLEIQDAKK